MSEAPSAHKLLALDALRGVAACAVVLYHRSGTMPFPKGYLAVDFFFMLSGFVLAFGYQAKLDSGWSTKGFLLTRMARLYPLYLLGFLLGFVVSLSDPAMQIGVQGWGSAMMNLFMLPAWTSSHIGSQHAFPYDIPAWSLSLEIFANVVHALFLRRRSTVLLTVIVLFSAGGLVAWSGQGPINFGADTSEFPGALLRVLFGYVAGMVLCRVWARLSWRPYLWSPILVIVLLVVLAGLGAARIGGPFDLIVVLGVFPILLFLAAGSRLNRAVKGMSRELGAVSYGVYILHQPVLQFLRLHGWSSPKSGGVVLHVAASVCFVGGMFVLVAMVDRWYDAPVREFLKRRITPWPPRVPMSEVREMPTGLI